MNFPVMRFVVEDRSMEPTIKHGERVVVRRFVFGKPKTGDIVVLNHPEKNIKIIKRIVKSLKDNKYLVVGDNLKYSKDSRHFGAIKRDLIVGKVWFRY